jgi:hypothetical protein
LLERKKKELPGWFGGFVRPSVWLSYALQGVLLMLLHVCVINNESEFYLCFFLPLRFLCNDEHIKFGEKESRFFFI